MKKTSNPWFKGSSYFPHGFRNTSTGFGADRSSSSFLPRDLISILFIFEEQYLPGFLSQISAGLRLSRPYLCASLAPRTKPTISSVAFCLRSFNHTKAQGFLRSSAQGSSHVSPHLLCHRAELRNAWKRCLLSARFCNHHCRTSVDSEFSTGSCRVLFWKLTATQLGFTKRGFLLFPTDIFASPLTNPSTPGHPSRTGAPRVVVLLPS